MDKNELYDVADRMAELMTEKELLMSLMKAMDVQELYENLEYIDRMHETGAFTDDDEEAEE